MTAPSERLALIVSLCHRLANADSLEGMFATVVEALAAGTGLARTSVLTLDSAGAMRFCAWRGLSEAYRRRVDGHSPWPADSTAPPEILVPDVATHELTSPLAPVFAQERIAAVAFLPLVAGGQLLGKFMLYSEVVRDWRQVDLPFARAVGDLMASFLLRERTQQRLSQARKMESLGFLAGGIAHDFNNLLTAMLGYAELLRSEDALGATARAHVERLLAVTGQAADLTRQLLGFARPKPLQIEVVDLAAVVQEALPVLQTMCNGVVEVRVQTARQPLAVSGNSTQLLQVLRNLVANARDAMQGGGVVTVAVRATPAREDSVDLVVADTGIGMDEALRSRIFEPLFTTKGPGRGTGLGLSICYGIVTHLGGEITVTSKPGVGSTFVVTLPRVPAPPVTTQPPAVREPSPHGLRVLLVEDQEEVRASLATGLTACGCRVTAVGDGSAALEALPEGAFDVVISDVVMPRMGGVELVERLQSEAASPPVLLITGYAEVAQELPAHVPVLQKPFAPAELARRAALVAQAAKSHA